MAKRFIRPNWKVLRKLPQELRQAWFYCWDQADAIGVYEYDTLYMQADLGFVVNFDELLKLPEAEKISPEKFLFRDFIAVNYTKLKHEYNPHKPAWRALEQNGLSINSSLNQACYKLIKEEEDVNEGKDEEEGEDKGGAGGIDPVFKNQVEFIVADLNSKAGTEYRPSSKKTQALIRARMAEGFSLSDFEHVHSVKCLEWLNTDKEQYLRPETLYGPKFESYKNQRIPVAKPTGGGKGTFDRATVADGVRKLFNP